MVVKNNMEPVNTSWICPSQLKTWQFILLQPKEKIPIAEMKGWQISRPQNTLNIHNPKLYEHFAAGGNIAVCADYDRFIIACDTKDAEQAVTSRLPPTFTVMSPRHKTKHFYYYGQISNHITFKPSSQGDPCIDLRIKNSYVVAPQCTYKDYGRYQIIDDLPIATITEDQLKAALNEFIQIQQAPSFTNTDTQNPTNTITFPITNLIPNLDNYTQNGCDVMGPHPVHGSTTGTNFHVDVQKNIWFCFRHNTGGGALDLLAVQEGVIRCEEAGKGVLRADKFRKTVLIAIEKGFVDRDKVSPLSYVASDVEKLSHQQKVLVTLQELCVFTFVAPMDSEELYMYQDGIYVEAVPKIKKWLENKYYAENTQYFTNEIIAHLKRANYTERDNFNNYVKNPYLPLQNGLYNLVTQKLEPHNPQVIFTFKLPIVYDGAADCPNFKRWLDETIDPVDHALLQEHAGYTLLPSMPFAKTLWLIGSGGNGKSTLVNTMESVLGKENCININTHQLVFDNRFVLAQFYGKLLNVCNEPGVQKTFHTEIFKALTGGDTLTAELKNVQKPLIFRNFAKIWISGNQYPTFSDNTDGFRRRIDIIKMSNKFVEGAGQKPNIQRSWLRDPDERAGIFNWMVEGLNRLVDVERFSASKNQLETMLELERASNSAVSWLHEAVIRDRDGCVVKSDAWENYKSYCNDYGLVQVKECEFNKVLSGVSGVSSGRRRVFKERQYVWVGLRFNPEFLSKNDAEDEEASF